MNKPKQKTCRICKTKFPAYLSTSIVCSIKCAIEHTQKANARLEARRKLIAKREHKQALEAIKTRSDWLKEAQFWFNKFIRIRDENQPCISCGRLHSGQYHAGHYRTVGSAPHLRFDEENVHKQCAPCNNHLSGNIINYRLRLIEKIGIESISRLESDNLSKHYTIDDIKQIKATYKAKCRELERIRDEIY